LSKGKGDLPAASFRSPEESTSDLYLNNGVITMDHGWASSKRLNAEE